MTNHYTPKLRRHLLRSLVILVILLGFNDSLIKAQTIATIPGTYPNVNAMVNDLNTNGVPAGGFIVNVTAGLSEVAPAGGYFLGSGALNSTLSAANYLIIQKSGAGANPLLTANAGTITPTTLGGLGDGIFTMKGVDYVTIDGIDLADAGTNATTLTQMEWGYGMFKLNATAPLDGCNNNTIKNCTVTLYRTNVYSIAINLDNRVYTSVTALINASPSDAQSNNKFYSNTLRNTYSGFYLRGYNSASTTVTNWDTNNDVGGASAGTGNSVKSYAGVTLGYGVYAQNQINGNFSYNTFDNYNGGLFGGISATGGTVYGVYHANSSTGTLDIPFNNTITNNTMLFTFAAGSAGSYGIYEYYCGGNNNINNNSITWATTGTCTGTWYGIYYYYGHSAGGGAGKTSNCNNNTITGTFANSTGTVYGIYHYQQAAQTVNFTGNQVVNLTRTAHTTGSMYLLAPYYSLSYATPGYTTNIFNNNINNVTCGTIGSSSTVYGYYSLGGNYNVNIYNNNISNVTNAGTGSLYGMYPYYYGTVWNIYNNTISNLTLNTNTGVSAGGTLYGWYNYPYYGATVNIYGNSISGLTHGGATGTIYGFMQYYNGGNSTIYKNKISNISNNSTIAGASNMYGIYNYSYAGANANSGTKYFNNIVEAGNNTAGASTTLLSSGGVYAGYFTIGTAYTAQVYNNTFLTFGNSAQAAFGAHGIFWGSASANLDLRNNIIYNLGSNTNATPTSKTTCIRPASTAFATQYASTSNNNEIYMPNTTGSTVRYLYYDGTTGYTDLPTLNAALTPRESNSFSNAPSFLSLDYTNANFGKIDASVTSQIESGGQTSALYTDDYFGNVRYGNLGYAGTGSSYDVGAYEFNGTSPAPAITGVSITPSTTQCTATLRTVTATITTPAGSTITAATLNYSYNGGAAVPVTMTNSSGNTWTATIPAATPANAAVTWAIVATNDVPLNANYTGASYSDEPYLGIAATLYSSTSPVCAGSSTTLSLNIPGPQVVPTGYGTSNATNTTDDEIWRVKINGTALNNASTCSSTGGGALNGLPASIQNEYSNYTYLAPITLAGGSTYTGSLDLSNCATGTYSQGDAIFIDLNRNGVFDLPTEKVYVSATTQLGGNYTVGTGFTTYSFSFTLPLNITPGLTLMRVIGVESTTSINPTGTYSWGETEDYLVNLVGIPSGVTYSWFDNGSPIGTGSSFVYTPTASTTNITMSAVDNTTGCTFGSAAPISVTVSPLVSTPTSTPGSQCGTGIPTCSVASTSGAGSPQFNWYSASTGGSLLQTYPFGSVAPFYNNDFTSVTLTGASISGTAALNGTACVLQTALTSQQGGFTVNASGINGNAYTIDYDMALTATGTTLADGYSYSFGDDAAASTVSPTAEHGSGSKLRIGFFTYNAASGSDGKGIYLMYNVSATSGYTSATSGVLAYSTDVSWVPVAAGTVSNHVSISINALGQLTLVVGATTIFTNVQLPAGFISSDKSTWKHVFSSRAGGVAGGYSLDNVVIQQSSPSAGSTTYLSSISATTTFYVSEIGVCPSLRVPVTQTVSNGDLVALTSVGGYSTYCYSGGIPLNLSQTGTNLNAYVFTLSAVPATGSGVPTPITVSTGALPITPTAVGTYAYTINATDGVCNATSTVTVGAQNPPSAPTLTATANPVCSGSSTTLSGKILGSGPQTLPTGYGTSSATSTSDDEIWRVKINGTALDNASTCATTGGGALNGLPASAINMYSNYTYLAPISLTAGNTYTGSLDISNCATGTYSQGDVIFIDLNRNGVFDLPAEKVYASTSTQLGGNYSVPPGYLTYPFSFTLPASVTPGLTLMRVIGVESTTTINPTGTYTWGETEDYMVNLIGDASSSYSWTWNPGALTGSSITLTPTTGATSTTTNYVATASWPNSTCSSTDNMNLVINPTPAIPTATNSVQCGAGVPTCSVSGVGSNFVWYSAATGGILLQTGGSTYTSSISLTKTFYVSELLGTCEGPRVAVTATVNAPPALTSSATQTVCNDTPVALSVTSNLSDYNTYTWLPIAGLYTDAAGTIPYTLNANASTVYARTTTAGTSTWTVTGYNTTSFCQQQSTSNVYVQPGTLSVTNTGQNNFCVSGSTTLTTNPAGGYAVGTVFQWQDSPDGVNFTDITGATSQNYTIPAITATTYYRYYIVYNSVTCATSSAITMSVNSPQVGTITPGFHCGPGPVTLSAALGAGAVALNWYTASTGGLPVASNSLTYTTPSIATTTNYYVAASSGGVSNLTIPGDGDWSHVTTSGAFQTTTNTGAILTVLQPLTLSSMDIYPSAGIGTAFVVEARTGSASGTTFLSYSGLTTVQNVTTPTVAQTLPVNWVLPVGTYYIVFPSTSVNPNTWRSAATHTYPWVLAGYVSLNYDLTPSYQYYFYNLKIATGCESNRVAVAANITAPPTLTLTPNQSVCNNVITPLAVTSTLSNFDTYVWSPTTYLFTDAAATIPYSGGSATSLYYRTTTPGTTNYSITATNNTSSCVNIQPISVTNLSNLTGSTFSVVQQFDCSSQNLITVTPNSAAPLLPWYYNDFSSPTLNATQAQLFGNAAVITGGKLALDGTTSVTTGTNGAIQVFNPNGYDAKAFQIDFDLNVVYGNGNADGVSYSFGDDVIPIPNFLPTAPENGSGTKLKLAFDSYVNGGNLQGVYLMYNCNVNNQTPTTPGVLGFVPNTTWFSTGSTTKHISISIDNSGYITVSLGGTVIFNNIALPPSYLTANKSTWSHVFCARTGSVFEQHNIDNFSVQYIDPNFFQYSKDAGASWQLSNIFSVAAGTYPISIRSTTNTTCPGNLGNAVVGTPSFSTFSSSASVCAYSVSMPTLSFAPAFGGATYQWESSPASGNTWTVISGATSNTYTPPVGSISINTKFRCRIFCSSVEIAGSPSIPTTVTVSAPTVASSLAGTRCGLGTVALTGTPSSGASLNWYAAATGGTTLGTGNSFTTPVINTTTSYYVSAAAGGSTSYNVGKNDFAYYSYGTGVTNYGIQFDATSSFVLSSVVIYPYSATNGTAGTVTIALTNSAGTILQQATVSTTGYNQSTTPTPQTAYLNFAVTPGTGYQLVLLSMTGVTGMCYQYSGGSATPYPYPYTVPGTVSITNGLLAGTTYNYYYYYFYDWSVSVGCESSRTAVAANVTAAPAITPSASPASLCGGVSTSLSATSSNAGYTYSWSPGNLVGNPVSASPNGTTTYTVTATDNSAGPNAGCVVQATQYVFVDPTSAVSVTPQAAVRFPGNSTNVVAVAGVINALVGTGTVQNATNATANMPPYGRYYTSNRHQMLVLASELTAQGLSAGSAISSITFDVASGAGGTFNGFTISIGATAVSALTSTFETSALTQVYSGNYTAVTGPNEHVFNSPFTWNGTSNILVETSFSNCGSCSGANCSTSNFTTSAIQNQSNTAFVSHSWFYSDATNACSPLSATGASLTANVRPNMIFKSGTPATFTWAPPTGLFTDAGLTTPYAGAPATASSLYASPSTTTTYTATSTTSFGACGFTSGSTTITVVTTPPSCPASVSVINSSCITATKLSWSAVPQYTDGYHVYVGTDGGGVALPSDVVYQQDVLTATSLTLPILQPNTTYYYYIAPYNVNGESTTCTIGSFTSGVSITQVPTQSPASYKETIDNGVVPPAVPCGMTTSNENFPQDAFTWYSSNVAPHAGLRHLRIDKNTNNTTAKDDWFYSAPMNMTAGKLYRIYFWHRVSTAGNESFEVFLSNSNDAATMLTTSSVFTGTSSLTTYKLDSSSDIIPFTTGVYYYGFHANGASNGRSLYMDDIQVREIPVAALDPASCVTIPSMYDQLLVQPVFGAQDYKFRIENLSTSFSYEYTRNLPIPDFRLKWAPGVVYDLTYDVSVSYKKNNVWSPYGASCPVTMGPFPTTKLRGASCGASLTDQYTQLYIDSVSGANDYEYRIVQNTLAYDHTWLRGAPVLDYRLYWAYQSVPTLVDRIPYGFTYDVQVRALVGKTGAAQGFLPGVWGTFGPVCTVTLAGQPQTQLKPTSCGVTLANITDQIFCVAVTGASNYRYHVVNTALGYDVTAMRNSSVNDYRLTWLPTVSGVGLRFSTTYDITVSDYVGGVWSTEGPMCQVTTPAQPLTQLQPAYCLYTLPTFATPVYSVAVAGATNYRYRITDVATSGATYTKIVDRNSPGTDFKFSWTLVCCGGLNMLPNQPYHVEVASYAGGVWSAYGSVCTVTSSATVPRYSPFIAEEGLTEAQNLSLSVYPNPAAVAEEFAIELSGIQVANSKVEISIYNMLGEKAYRSEVVTKTESNLIIKPEQILAPGVYMVEAKLDGNVYREKFVVK